MPDYEAMLGSFLLFVLFILSLTGLILGVVFGTLLSMKQWRQEREEKKAYKAHIKMLSEISCDSPLANSNTANLTIDKQVYSKGEKILVSYNVPKEILRFEDDNHKAWIGMYQKDAPHGKWKNFFYINYHKKTDGKGKEINQPVGSIAFKALKVGSYELRLYDNYLYYENIIQTMRNDPVNRTHLVKRIFFQVEG